MRILSIIAILFISLSVFAENEKGKNTETSGTQISGKVIDHMTGENLAGVKIQVMNSDIVVYTDLDGNFLLDFPTNTNQSQLQITYISYETMVVNSESLTKTGEIKILPVSR